MSLAARYTVRLLVLIVSCSVVVTEVRRETPGYTAGINVGDEILAIGAYRVPPDGLTRRLAQYAAGERVSILVARRERLVRLDVTLGTRQEDHWTLQVDPDATPSQAARLAGWLE